MFGIIKKTFIILLSSIINTSKCISLSNQKCEIQLTLINLHPNEYSQELQYKHKRPHILLFQGYYQYKKF